MNIYKYYNKPIELKHWHKDDKNNIGSVEYYGTGLNKLFSDGRGYWYKDGVFHREDGPAATYSNGTKEWYLYGKLHRKYWYKNGLLHREDGPAAILYDGTEYWYKNGLLHREDGPAVIGADGSKFWYTNGVYIK